MPNENCLSEEIDNASVNETTEPVQILRQLAPYHRLELGGYIQHCDVFRYTLTRAKALSACDLDGKPRNPVCRSANHGATPKSKLCGGVAEQPEPPHSAVDWSTNGR